MNPQELKRLVSLELAKRDAKHFIFEYCQTRFRKRELREGRESKDRDALTELDFVYKNVQATIPRYLYIEKLVDCLGSYQQLAIPKSRQLMVSWVACAFCLWYALFQKGANIYIQKEKESESGFGDPIDSMLSRVQFIYDSLPEELKDPQFRVIKSPPTLHFGTSGSAIMGVASGANQLRGKAASIVVIDEAAMQRFLRDTLTTIMPIVQSGSQIILISTPNGKESFYETISDGGNQC
jgi:hypothetical protein